MVRNMKVVVVVIAVSLVASVAWADKLQDFKDAVAAPPGCGSIPYKDLFKMCDGRGGPMHDWCDGRKGAVTCDQGTTRRLKEDLERERRNYEKLREKKRELEDKRYRSGDDNEKSRLQSEIDAVSKEIDESERASNAIRTAIDKRRDFVRNTISTIETCIDHRVAVMAVFAEALDKVRNENDDDIKPLARTLRDRFEASKSGHEVAITGKKNAKDNCRSEDP